MSNYPNAIDGPATLYSPVDAFSTRPLETTATQQILAGDTTISVGSTEGFAPTYGILSVDDELIVYASKTATQFTGCQRGAFGTTAAQHSQGVAVKANMVSAFITALQSAVTAIENELGTVAARNYVRRDGAVTITGVKTFVDGAEFGSGVKAATGLVRLPNAGTIKWRKADGSGDLGMALNANDHLAFDAIIDFAPGQTFGSFSYPDATTTSKGIVQVDPVGGIAVNAGVISLADSGATPGTYSKVTVDAKGRVTTGAPLSASDLPAHQHVASDIVSGALALARGGTGASTASGARTNLGAAASGANSDITSLTAVTSVNGATLTLKTGGIDRIEIAADGTVTNKTYGGLWNLGTTSKLRVAKIQFWDALVNAKAFFFHLDWDTVDGRYEFQGSPSVAQYGGGWRYDATNGTLQAVLSYNSGVQDAAATVLPRFSITKDGRIIFTTSGIPVYANNAAAVAGGLTPGMLYRTGGDPDVLAIVH